jgi:hypothetical protein
VFLLLTDCREQVLRILKRGLLCLFRILSVFLGYLGGPRRADRFEHGELLGENLVCLAAQAVGDQRAQAGGKSRERRLVVV